MAPIPKVLCLVWLLALPARAQEAWHESRSLHFNLLHEDRLVPVGYLPGLEKLYSRLRMDLAVFSPWMEKERLKVYLYAGQESYMSGDFKPPKWSDGLSVYEKKVVVTYVHEDDLYRFFPVVAHEFSHLLFGLFWGKADRRPPIWLNEGMAMLGETSAVGPVESSDWYLNMLAWPRKEFLPLDRFILLHPAVDYKGLRPDDRRVCVWYTQAFSLVYYLYRGHTRLQFKDFCTRLRDGYSFESALQSSYHIRDLNVLENDWRTWLGSPKERSRPTSTPRGW